MASLKQPKVPFEFDWTREDERIFQASDLQSADAEQHPNLFTYLETSAHPFSRFYPGASFTVDGKFYSTVEHYCSSKKCAEPQEEEMIRQSSTAEEAHVKGRTITLRKDWNDAKLSFSVIAFYYQIKQNNQMWQALLATGEKYIITIGTDEFWEACAGPADLLQGRNMSGKILMKIRDELKKEKSESGLNHQN